MKRTILILCISIFLFSSKSFSQLGLWELGGNRNLNSVFERYVRPNFSSKVKCYFDSLRIENLLNRCHDCAASYTFIIILKSSHDSTVANIDVMPVEELFFNREKLPDDIIKSIIESIKSVSKYWILKPKKIKSRNNSSTENDLTGTEENNYTRIPNVGKLLFILYEITIASSRLESYDEILFINEPY
ncbi:MAG TPA: hypothetical protein PKY56_09485 [Candidatus Kapabacteria bacterium]|nr:hypothetical protein [Candidatus Kapabacteria bacterium]